MSRYLLQHRHEPARVRRRLRRVQGIREPTSPPPNPRLVPLRRTRIWWTVEAETEVDALRLLPYDVAERTTVSRVSEVEIGRLPAAEREEE